MENIIEENSDIGSYNDGTEEFIIFKTLNKMNLIKENKDIENLSDIVSINKKKGKIEKAEDKIIKKIYEKFGINKKFSSNEPIDLVYTYINYDDMEFRKNREKELKGKGYLRRMKLTIDTIEVMERYLKEERSYFDDFFINLEITRKNMLFVRNIFIITPTPFILNEIYHNDDNIYIINSDDIGGNNVFFRPNNILFNLGKLKFLSRIFLFGNQDCFVSKPINKNDLLKDGIPKFCWEKRTLLEKNLVNNGIRYLEEYNSNREFEENFNIFPKLVCLNQVNLVRKDVLQMMDKLYKYEMNVDYLLLQYLTGYFFNLYELDLSVKEKSSGFYEYNSKMPYDRFILLKNNQVNYFCLNHLNKKIMNYYVYAALINMGLIKNSKIKTVYFNNLIISNIYDLPNLERQLRNYGLNLQRWTGQKGKLGESILLNFGDCKEVNMIKMDVKGLCIESIFWDILYFSNVIFEGGVKGWRNGLEIYYPKDFLRKMELKTRIPFTRIFPYSAFDEESTGVKSCNIKFSNKLKK